jgi:hypothetical protein
MNRDQRRHPGQDVRTQNTPEQTTREEGRPPTTQDPRTKSTGHGKKTADKWNQ